jgi:site-specific DNA recombinase
MASNTLDTFGRRLPPHFGKIDPDAPFDVQRFFTALRTTGDTPSVLYSIDDDKLQINIDTHWPKTELQIKRLSDLSSWERNKDPTRMASIGGTHAPHAPKSKRVLSGLLKCGCCGGGMSIIGSDRSGPGIQCSVFKESGTCDNAARYYIQKIEKLVIGALRLQLSDPAIIREYVKTYLEERNRSESEARRKRSTLDRDYAKAESEIQRLVSSIAKGLITDDEAASLLDTARREITRLEAELATADSNTNVIELHPQAVQRFKENVEALAHILVTKDGLPDLELMGTFRSLVESVIVRPRKAGEEYEVSIRGYLASLMGAEVSAFLVSAEGLEPPTQDYDFRCSI